GVGGVGEQRSPGPPARPSRAGHRQPLDPAPLPIETEKAVAARGGNLHMISRPGGASRSAAAAVLQCTLGWATQKAASPRGVRKHVAQAIPPLQGERGPPGDTIEGSIMDAKTGANIKTGKFIAGGKETSFP